MAWRLRVVALVRTWCPDFEPPFCPRASCPHHRAPDGKWYVKDGHHDRKAWPHAIRRFRCKTCRRCFSTQTFDTTYWLKRPDLQPEIFKRQVECSGLRQSARGLGVAPSTVQMQVERLGRHCLLEQRARTLELVPREPFTLDGFRTFEFSQYWPFDFNIAVGKDSDFVYGFTDSELRRSGRMTARQKRRRRELEKLHGKPDPRATEMGVETLLRAVAPHPTKLVMFSDEHEAYLRALKKLEGHEVEHHAVSSRRIRNAQNPLRPSNLLDSLIRHCGSNHKRETIAWSKRRQAAAERMAIFQVWRNFAKSRSEQRPKTTPTPAMVVGLTTRPLTIDEILYRRRFPSLVPLPERVAAYYWRKVETRQLGHGRQHVLKYAD